MSQVQQLSPRQAQAREQYKDPLEGRRQRYEAILLSEVFRRNGREQVVQSATPPGYSYVREDIRPSAQIDADGPIMQIAAHPGDGPDFFYATYLQMAANVHYCRDYHEILLTDGERGVEGWHSAKTRQVRKEEAFAGAKVVGSTLHFLGYPDGGLAVLEESQKKCLIAELAALIGDIQPALLVVHPPKTDHPDHAHSFLFTLAALQQNAQARRRIPALFIHDVEFGLQQPDLWTLPASEPCAERYPMHSPDFIVDISSTHQTAQCALHEHKTQMYDPVLGRPKAYADLIDTVARIRGLQLATENSVPFLRGQGLSQVVIPGVTETRNIAALRLPAGSLYRRVTQSK